MSANQPQQPKVINIFPADTSGCNFFRNYLPYLTLETVDRNLIFNINRKFVVDQQFFNNVNVNIFQRQVSNEQAVYYNQFVMPLAKAKGSWIIYNIDDCVGNESIPEYNVAYDAYNKQELMDNIQKMMDNSDFLLVTTNELKAYYNDRFKIPNENIIVIPNYLAKWWFVDSYNKERCLSLYRKNVNRPRIGLISSASHYDMNKRGIPDDSTEISKYIRSTVNKYKWVIFGALIPSLEDLINSKQVEFYPGAPLLHYPQAIKNLQLQGIVAPLIDNMFNRCKSNIKLLDGWALGIPVFAQDICTYNKYTKDVFKNNDELDALIKSKLQSTGCFERCIEENWSKMQSWWLEDHLQEWHNLYAMKNKYITLNVDNYINFKKQQKLDAIKNFTAENKA